MLNVNSKQMKQDDKKGYIKIIKLNIYINDLFFFWSLKHMAYRTIPYRRESGNFPRNMNK